MAKELKVLMMGGKRVGKSSALAAIMEAFIDGLVSSMLTATDKTMLEKKEGVKQTSIPAKLQEVKTMLQRNAGKTVLADSGRTEIKWDYKLKLNIPGKSETMTIVFTDINGEFFEDDNLHRQETMQMIAQYDVFIVAIDTPFMVEARSGEDLVDDVINRKYNCIDSIHSFLTKIDDKDGQDAKLVIFAPIKCEKWAKANQLDMVSDYVMEDYKTTISALLKYQKVQIEIIPIQTVGSIVFEEHKEAYLFNWQKRQMLFWKKNMISKCAVLDNGNVRLSDGTEMSHKEGSVSDDPSAILIPGTDIIRPNSWFKVLSADYKPYNCEQLAFHILDFMLSKIIDIKVRQAENQDAFIADLMKIGNKLLNAISFGVWKAIKDVFGGIPIEDMDKIVNRMIELRLIKRDCEGIRILKQCDFKTLKRE